MRSYTFHLINIFNYFSNLCHPMFASEITYLLLLSLTNCTLPSKVVAIEKIEKFLEIT